jgi:hypothetical protein
LNIGFSRWEVPITNLDIQSKMKEKLEPMLARVPGKFAYHPKLVSKLSQLRRFRKSGIPCPDFSTDLEVAKTWVKAGDQVFGRDKKHEKGLDIVDQRSPAWADKDFWSKVIPNVASEYRVHIFDGERIQQGLKCFDPMAEKKRIDDLPIRNTETGWRYNHLFKPSDGSVDLAKHAVQELGYLWGAVDILEDASGTCYVLEVNTAPGMDDTTAHAYADAIERHVQRVHGH